MRTEETLLLNDELYRLIWPC